jgi:FkbM family methyltransferase
MKKILKRIFFNKILQVRSKSLNGLKLRVNHLINGAIFIEDYEPDKQTAIKLLMPEAGIFFDIGANVGLHSYFVAKHFPKAKIHSFEPLPDNLDYLAETLQNNQITSISIVPAAVGSASGESFFDISNSNFKGNLSKTQTSLKVKLIALDDFIDEHVLFPDLIKIDVEGAECDVLKGAQKSIEATHPTFIIELHTPEQDLLVAGFLVTLGYWLFRINPKAAELNQRCFLSIKNLTTSWPDPDGVWGNIAAIHSSKLERFKL